MESPVSQESRSLADAARCEYCGGGVARHEPLWLELHDGEVRLTSAAATERELVTGRMWHARCLRRPALVALR